MATMAIASHNSGVVLHATMLPSVGLKSLNKKQNRVFETHFTAELSFCVAFCVVFRVPVVSTWLRISHCITMLTL